MMTAAMKCIWQVLLENLLVIKKDKGKERQILPGRRHLIVNVRYGTTHFSNLVYYYDSGHTQWWSLNGYVLDSDIRDDIKLKG